MKTLLAYLLPSSPDHSLAAAFLLAQLRTNTLGILTAVETNRPDGGDTDRTGRFLDLMEAALESDSGRDLLTSSQEIIKYALDVSKACLRDDEEEILLGRIFIALDIYGRHSVGKGRNESLRLLEHYNFGGRRNGRIV